MMGSVRVAATSWRLAWLSELSHRTNFLVQMLFMVINDLTWVVFWVIVFSHRELIRGWERADVFVLFAVITAVYGVGLGLFHGVRRLGERIRRGELDPFLAQPRPVLVRVLFGRIHPPLLGDLAFGPMIFLCSGLAGDPVAWLRYVLVVLAASAILLAFILVIESTAFWMAAGSEFANVAFTAMTVLASYPASIFSGFVKLILFTAIPAAFVGSVPAEIVIEPSVGLMLALVAAALVSWAVAVATFQSGLRRYLRTS